jgi:NADH-quinone oxidoreductase subunit M
MYQRVIYGDLTQEENKHLKDMNARELMTMVPIMVFIVWIGVYPKPFLNTMHASVDHLIDRVNQSKIVSTEISKINLLE